jgi:thiamine-phosphate pyrophosphorylase
MAEGGDRKVDFRVCLVTDRKQAPGEAIVPVVVEALRGGIRAVQLREKDLPARDLLRLARELREATARHGARLLVNDRVDVAMAAGADGVHLGVSSLRPREARRLLGPKGLVGCSTHSLRELAEAEEGGADFVTFGPVFFTPSKAAYGPPVGLPALAAACRAARIPVFALGGVGAGNLDVVLSAGAHGVALVSGVVAAPDPRSAASALTARFTDGGR